MKDSGSNVIFIYFIGIAIFNNRSCKTGQSLEVTSIFSEFQDAAPTAVQLTPL